MTGRRRSAAVGTLLLGSIALLGGCGGGGGSSADYKEPAGPAGATLTIDAGNYFFTPKAPTVAAGIVDLRLKNSSGTPHTLAIAGIKGYELSVSGSGTDAEKVDLKPGSYTFYCTIPGHREQGMQGTLKVK